MTKEQTKEVVRGIETVYRNYFKNESIEDARARLEFWAIAFVNEPAQEVREALVEAMKVCQHPPTIADVFTQLRAKRAKSVPSEGATWEMTCKIEKQMRTNRERAAVGGYYDAEGKHTQSELLDENQRLFRRLPPAVQEWAGSANGLIDMFDRSDADISAYIRPQFKKVYEAAKAEKIKELEKLPPAERPELTG